MATAETPQIVYPDSDGQPMSDNTLQFEWIVTLKGGLEAVFADDPNVFVAGDLLWYYVEGDPTRRIAPDAMVAFGRPKGYRGSYKQWEEGGIAPQVVFEVLSPGNRPGEMAEKRRVYEANGVEEYYVYDPDRVILTGYLHDGSVLRPIPRMDGWISPRMGIRFDMTGEQLQVFDPAGRPFTTYLETKQEADRQARRADLEQRRADDERRRADDERRRGDDARQRADRLAARLRELGLDPDA